MTVLARPHDARGAEEGERLCRVPWRPGASLGRSVYAVWGEGGHEQARDDEAVLIGTFDTAALAAEAVEAHNARLGASPGTIAPGATESLASGPPGPASRRPS